MKVEWREVWVRVVVLLLLVSSRRADAAVLGYDGFAAGADPGAGEYVPNPGVMTDGRHRLTTGQDPVLDGFSGSWSHQTGHFELGAVPGPSLTYEDGAHAILETGNAAFRAYTGSSTRALDASALGFGQPGARYISYLMKLDDPTAEARIDFGEAAFQDWGQLGLRVENGWINARFAGQTTVPIAATDTNTHLFVWKVESGAVETATLYMDPILSAEFANTGVVVATVQANTYAPTHLTLTKRSGSDGVVVAFDELRVGETWNDVTTVAEPEDESAAVRLHVSPSGGTAGTGSAAAPFGTLEEARDEIRALRAAGTNGLAVVWLHGGDYAYTNKTFDLNASDLNTIYRAVPGEPAPRLNGGAILDPAWFSVVDAGSPVWARVDTAARGHLLRVDLAARGITDYGTLKNRGFNQYASSSAMELFVDDEVMRLGRYPNGDTFDHVATALDAKSFKYAGTRPERWKDAEDVWFQGLWAYEWADGARAAARINTKNKKVSLTSEPTPYGIVAGQPYFAFNLLEEIDEPGEYYINRESGILYFWPPYDLAGRRVVVSMSENPLVDVEGASNVVFEGVALEAGRTRLARIHGESAAVVMRDGWLINGGSDAIKISTEPGADGAGRSNGLYRCEIRNMGTSGITLDGGDLAALTVAENFAEQCLIENFARLSWTYNPGVNLVGVGQIARGNEIANAPHLAIGLKCADSVIEFNEVRDVVRWTGDSGAFYGGRSWVRRGNSISYNHIHDIQSVNGSKVAGIYLDDALSGQVLRGNVLNRVQNRAAVNNGGRDNAWENNLILHSGVGHYGTTIGIANITNDGGSWDMLADMNEVDYQGAVWAGAYPELAAITNDYSAWTHETKGPGGTVFSRNVFWGNTINTQENNYAGGNAAFSYYAEMTNNLTGVDPLFEDPANDDYRLKAESPAFQIPGFVDVPFERMGRDPISVRNWPAPPDGVSGRTTVAARVHAPDEPTEVWCCYGPFDAGDDPAAWPNATARSTNLVEGFVTASVFPTAGQEFVAKWFAESSSYSSWSDSFILRDDGD